MNDALNIVKICLVTLYLVDRDGVQVEANIAEVLSSWRCIWRHPGDDLRG